MGRFGRSYIVRLHGARARGIGHLEVVVVVIMGIEIERAAAPLPSRQCDAGAPALGLALAALHHQTGRRGCESTAALLRESQQRIGVAVVLEGQVLIRRLR